jgi:replicative DNA helicase
VAIAESFASAGPQSDDLEFRIIGHMLGWHDAAVWGAERLEPEHFYGPSARTIFRTIQAMVRQRLYVDVGTVIDRMTKTGKLASVGGEMYLLQMEAQVALRGAPDVNSVRYLAPNLIDYYARRSLMERAAKLVKAAQDTETPLQEVLSAAHAIPRRLAKIGSDTYSTADYDPSEQAGLKGVTTGLPCIDKHVGGRGVGFPKAGLSVVGARRGGGKTGFMVSSLVAAKKAGYRTAYATLEMKGKRITDRMVQNLCGWDVAPIVSTFASEWKDAVDQVREWAVPMWDPSGLQGGEKTVDALCAWATDLADMVGLDELIVDYYQLLSAKGRWDNRTHELSYVADKLMWLGHETGAAIVAGSQLTKLPDGSVRAKDCIKIEDNAELVLYLTREKDGQSLLTPASVAFGKNRNGRETNEDVLWNRRHVRFEDPNPPKPDPFADDADQTNAPVEDPYFEELDA